MRREPIFLDPLTALAIGGIVTGVAAGGASAVSSWQMGEYQAKMAEQQGEGIKRAYEMDEVVHKENAERLQGSQRAAAAAMGINPNVGAPLEAVIQTEYRYMRDQARRKYNADLGIAQSQSAASAAKATGINQATGTLLGTASDAGLNLARWYRK